MGCLWTKPVLHSSGLCDFKRTQNGIGLGHIFLFGNLGEPNQSRDGRHIILLPAISSLPQDEIWHIARKKNFDYLTSRGIIVLPSEKD